MASLIAAGLTGPIARAVARPAMEPVAQRTYVVHSGDTIWSIAVAVAPHSDPRPLVKQIQEANHLDAAAIVPGQTLVVPRVG